MMMRLLPLLVLSAPALAVEVELGPGADIRSLTQSLGAGDVYIFEDGVYEITDRWNVTGAGTEDSPIIFRAALGARPIIRLTTAGDRVLRIADASWITVQGLTFEQDDERYETGAGGVNVHESTGVILEDCVVQHTGGTSIFVSGNSQQVVIRATEMVDTRDGSGLYVGCGDASCLPTGGVFEGNLIHDIKGRDEYRSDGLTLAPGAQGNEVRDNVIFGINRIGLMFHSTEFGAQNKVEGNAIWQTGSHGIWGSGSALVRNNLVFDVGGHAFYSENNRDSLENLAVSFNTFANSGAATVRLNDWAGHPDMVFANNAVANPVGSAFFANADDLDVDNLFTGNIITGAVEGLALEDGGFVPGGGFTDFEDWLNWNYYPSRSSTFRAAGDPSGATFVPGLDFSGFERNGESPTVGAYEFVSGSNPGWPIQEGFKTFEDSRVDSQNTTGGCCGKSGGASDGSEAALLLPFLGLGLLVRRKRRGVRR